MKLSFKTFSIKRMTTTLLFVFSIIIAQFATVQFASAASLTWDGSAGDGKFSTAENWSTGSAPVDGDLITFDASILTSSATLTNDITDLSLSGISFTGDGGDGTSVYTITGNALTLTGDVVNTSHYDSGSGTLILKTNLNVDINLAADVSISDAGISYGSTVTLNTNGYNLAYSSTRGCLIVPKLTGSGSIVFSGTGQYPSIVTQAANPSYTGAISVNSGRLFAVEGSLGSSSAGTTLSGSGGLVIISAADSTWSEPLTLSGSGSVGVFQSGCSGGSGPSVTVTWTGDVTLGSDFKYSGYENMVITGEYTSNSHTFSVEDGATGTITTPEGTAVAPVVTTDLSGDKPSENVTVVNKETATLSGNRGNVSVSQGGILKGVGTVNSLSVYGVVYPGNSPGTITALDNLALAGTLQSEILNTDTYDQLVVGENYSGGGSAVALNSGAILDFVLYDGWSITKDDAFTIIDNKSETAVSGTFKDLAEGAQFKIDGITFSISYVGGDGNDIVVTALNTGDDPNAPDTSVAQTVLSNPLTIISLGVVSAGIFAAVALRRRSNQ